MSNTINIAQIEQAINFWRQSDVSTQDGVSLTANASILADVYGQMIYNKSVSIAQADLSEDQLRALKAILD